MAIIQKIWCKIHARYRAAWWISWIESPRPDVMSGFARWKWLASQRRCGVLLDPTVEVRSSVNIDERLQLGRGAALDKGVILWIADECGETGQITISDGVYIGPYTLLSSCHTLEIGANSLIGAHCYLITVNHRTDRARIPMAEQGYRGGDIRIGKNVWIGAHVVVLPGVSVGDGAVIGAGAVVTKNVPQGETWGGVPARNLALLKSPNK